MFHLKFLIAKKNRCFPGKNGQSLSFLAEHIVNFSIWCHGTFSELCKQTQYLEKVASGLGCFDPECVSLPFHPSAGKEGSSQLRNGHGPHENLKGLFWKWKYTPRIKMGVGSHDHSCLETYLTLLASLIGHLWMPNTTLDWAGLDRRKPLL